MITQDHPLAKPKYWDQVVAKTAHGTPLDIWRSYMRKVYGNLIADCSEAFAGTGMKTDLFEEAVSEHAPIRDLANDSIGLDGSLAVVQAAKQRLPAAAKSYRLLVADLRRLPLKSEIVSCILSGSSLDHFATKGEIATSLSELVRVLTPGGVLIITFDNPHNPVVWLRNHLPYNLLHRFGLVPYYVGATYDREEARTQLERLGMSVTHSTCVAHVPRAPFIWLVTLMERFGWQRLNVPLTRMLNKFEKLGDTRTRYRTGYYLALRAVKSRKSGAI
jgi:ubiquinone/menaquinone biosynthesis C-methylase UbiE